MRRDGHGMGYRFPHDEHGGVALGEVYLPDKLVGTEYYAPTDRGFEKTIAERLRWIRSQRENAPVRPEVPIEPPVPPGLISSDTVPKDEPEEQDEPNAEEPQDATSGEEAVPKDEPVRQEEQGESPMNYVTETTP
jgi:hypothetical protein